MSPQERDLNHGQKPFSKVDTPLKTSQGKGGEKRARRSGGTRAHVI